MTIFVLALCDLNFKENQRGSGQYEGCPSSRDPFSKYCSQGFAPCCRGFALNYQEKGKKTLRHPVNTSVCMCVGGGLLRDCAGEKGHWDLYPYPIRLTSPAFCKHLNAYPVPVTDFPGATVSIKNTFEW